MILKMNFLHKMIVLKINANVIHFFKKGNTHCSKNEKKSVLLKVNTFSSLWHFTGIDFMHIPGNTYNWKLMCLKVCIIITLILKQNYIIWNSKSCPVSAFEKTFSSKIQYRMFGNYTNNMNNLISIKLWVDAEKWCKIIKKKNLIQ